MPSLTRAEAAIRAALISVTSYVVELDLTGGDREDQATFGSYTRIRFTCARPGEGTWVDLKASQVYAARLNGIAMDLSTVVDGRLPLQGLAVDNVLVVEAEMPYRRDGQGLHRAFDPADGQAYVYGHFFLDAAPSVVACFDQPDLKAPWTISVVVPQGWTVVGNGSTVEPLDGGRRFDLTTTLPLATYFVTVCAGPYASVHSEHDGIALGLFARASLRDLLERDAPRIMRLTGIFVDAYHRLFGIRYPFGGYNHVFVPEFNALAMENPGCVTIRDELLFRGAATPDEILGRDSTICHEMAHMWFGDLVTMQWWDDLWLNESFAEYLAYRVLAETGVHPGAWVGATMMRKPWGYAAERAPSTHPVAGSPALDADSALQDFDGISYAKGSSLLRQLIAYVGDEAFVAGVRDHLTRHSYGNATLADFVGSIARASGEDLTAWVDAWLLTAGRDTISARVDDGQLTVVRTRPVAGSVPPSVSTTADRRHRLDVAGYAGGQEVFRVDVTTTADETSVPLPHLLSPGVAAIEATDLVVIPNASDLSWAVVDLSAATWAALPSALPHLPDRQVRATVWVAALDAVAQARLAPSALVDLFCAAWPLEDDPAILQRVAGLLVARYVPDFFAPEHREAQRHRVSEAAKQLLHRAEPGSPPAVAAARVVAAVTSDHLLLREWASGLGLPEGLGGDSDFRWIVLRNLSARGLLTPAELQVAASQDTTIQGRLNALECRACMPDAESKQWAWAELTGREGGHSNFELNHLAQGFWHFEDADVVRPYVERYFADIPALHEWVGEDALARVAQLAFPMVVEERTDELSRAALARDDLSAAVRRSMLDADWKLQEALASRRRFG